MSKRFTTIAAVAALVCAVSSPAAAQHRRRRHGRPVRPAPTRPTETTAPEQTPPPDAVTVEARREYSQGQQLIESLPEQALRHFQRAYNLRPNPVVLLPIAEAQQRLGQVGEAIGTLERYLRDRPDAPDRDAIQQRLALLRTRPATVHVVSIPPNARIAIDGRETGQVTPADVPAEPGHRAVRVDLAGHQSFSQSIDATPGGRIDLRAQLVPSTSAGATASNTTDAASTSTSTGTGTGTGTGTATASPADDAALQTAAPAPRPASPWVWVAGGLAAAGLVAGSVFGFMALSDLSDYNAMPTPSTRNRGETNAILADVSFATALLSGITAVIVYASDRSSEGSQTQRAHRERFRFRPTLNGLTVQF